MTVAQTSARRALPYVLADQAHLELFGRSATALGLTFPRAAWEADVFLVIDIYSASNPVHPAGHVGWWKCALDHHRGVEVQLRRRKGGLAVEFDGQPAADQWVNADYDGRDDELLTVHVVLRQTATGAIVFEDTLHLYQSKSAVKTAAARREAFEQVAAPAISVPWYLWPRGAKVHVVAANLYEQDAVGNFGIGLCRAMRANRIDCRLYASHFDAALRPAIRHTAELLAGVEENDLVVLNFSIVDPWMPDIAALPCKKLLYFHNITPPRFFQVYDAEYAAHCSKGFEQVQYVDQFDAVLANSQVSAATLRELVHEKKADLARSQAAAGTNGHARATTDPHLAHGNGRATVNGNGHGAPLATIERAQDPFADASRLLQQAVRLLDRRDDRPLRIDACPPCLPLKDWNAILGQPVPLPARGTRLLYVGRIAPHKRIEDLLALFAQYKRLNADSALLLAGSNSFTGYSGYLQHVLANQYKRVARDVHFVGGVGDAVLKTLYEAASAYVSMSEHEGFCVPLVEAMALDKPIFAYADPAVCETLGRCGRRYYEKDFAAIAADMHHVLSDEAMREQLLAAQRSRLEELRAQADGRLLWSVLEEAMFSRASTV